MQQKVGRSLMVGDSIAYVIGIYPQVMIPAFFSKIPKIGNYAVWVIFVGQTSNKPEIDFLVINASGCNICFMFLTYSLVYQKKSISCMYMYCIHTYTYVYIFVICICIFIFHT